MINIIVNATALKSGGALSILKQFILNAKNQHRYFIFVDESVELPVKDKNFIFIKKNINSFFRRVIWDSFGLFSWVRKNNVKVDVVISLQNTSVNLMNIPQIIYLHQAIPLADKDWSFFKRKEMKYAFYKYIYPYFIFKHNHCNTHFVVQTQWMKTSLVNKFGVVDNKIHVIKPEVMDVNVDEIDEVKLKHSKSYLYPASKEAFKNHKVLLEAFYLLKSNGMKFDDFGLYFTFEKSYAPELVSLIEKFGLNDHVVFLGTLSYEKLLSYYKSCYCVVFPSLIESFGLPLIEATIFGKPLICNNTLSTSEVVSSYPLAKLLNNDITEWANALINVTENDIDTSSSKVEFQSGWDDFFKLVVNISV